MSLTLSPNDAFAYAKYYTKGVPLEVVKGEILNDASALFWNSGPWAWTLGTITSVTVGNVQEVTITKPADFLRLQRVWFERTPGSTDLKVVSFIPVTTQEGVPKYACYVSSGGDKVRFDVKYPASTEAAPNLRMIYKKTAPLFTNPYSTAGSLLFDDSYFYIYRECVLFAAYKFADDPRAGSVTITKAPGGQVQKQYTGQRALVQGLFEDLKLQEPVSWDMPETGSGTKDM